MNNRFRMAAGLFGIPLGVLENYGVLSSSEEGLQSFSAAGKANGFGGQTTSTRSAAWVTFQTSIKLLARSLEHWSRQTLARMALHKNHRELKSAVPRLQHEFYDQYGTDAEYQMSIEAETDQYQTFLHGARQQEWDSWLQKKAAALAQTVSKGALMFRLPRPQRYDLLTDAFMKYASKPEGVLYALENDEGVLSEFLGSAEDMVKFRELVNTPPEPAAGKAKKSSKAKK